jgi:epoxyqueuosine reductase QueG
MPVAPKKTTVRNQTLRLGAEFVGFAPVSRWREAGVKPGYRPEDILPGAQTVVVFGVPMILPIIDSTPSINYQEMYDTSNRLLDEIAFRLANWLNARGFASLNLPRDGYASLEALLKNPDGCFSHVLAGRFSGLGTIGLSHNLLVPAYGPRVRLNSVITALKLPGDKLLDKELCSRCNICARACPAQAIKPRKDGVIGDLDRDACTRHHIVLRDEGHWPCGVCCKVCLVGTDRDRFVSYTPKQYLAEPAAIAADASDPVYARLTHLRRHGSKKDRQC